MWGFEVGLAPSGITLICWPASTNLGYWTPSSDILVARQRQRIQLNSMPEASSPTSVVIGLTEPTTASPVQLNLANILFRFYDNGACTNIHIKMIRLQNYSYISYMAFPKTSGSYNVSLTSYVSTSCNKTHNSRGEVYTVKLRLF